MFWIHAPKNKPTILHSFTKKGKIIICFKGYGILTFRLIYTYNYPDIIQKLINTSEYIFQVF